MKYFLAQVTSEIDHETLLLFVISASNPNRLESEVDDAVMQTSLWRRFNALIAERAPRGKLTQITPSEFDRLRGAKIENINMTDLQLWWVKG